MAFLKTPFNKTHMLALFLGVSAVIGLGLWFTPYKTTLVADAAQMKNGIGLNMPCSRVELKPGEATTFETTVTGKGFAFVKHQFTDLDVRLYWVGALRDLDCTIKATIAKGEVLKIPTNMPFMARNGVYPQDLSGVNYRAFTRQ